MGYWEALAETLEKAYLRAEKRKVIIWGTGNTSKIISGILDSKGIEYFGFLDSDEIKTGTEFCKKEILDFVKIAMRKSEFYIVVAVKIEFANEIQEKLKAKNFSLNDYFILAAELTAEIEKNDMVLQLNRAYSSSLKEFSTKDLPFGEQYKNDGIWVDKLDYWQYKARQAICDKINNGSYKLEHVNCPCGKKDFQLLSEKDRYALSTGYSICKHCGLVMQNPRLNKDSLDALYKNDFAQLCISYPTLTPEEYFFWRKKDRGQDIFNNVRKYLSEDASILEIGCGTGWVLSCFKEKGYNVVGIDIDEEYLEYGRSVGLELYYGYSNVLLDKFEKSFDVVILSHVLEHFSDLEKELFVIKRLLKDSGVLYIEVPGLKGSWLEYYRFSFLNYLEIPHNYYFISSTIVQTVEKYGFKCLETNENIEAAFAIDEKLKNEVINYYDDTMRFLHTLESNTKKLQQRVFSADTEA